MANISAKRWVSVPSLRSLDKIISHNFEVILHILPSQPPIPCSNLVWLLLGFIGCKALWWYPLTKIGWKWHCWNGQTRLSIHPPYSVSVIQSSPSCLSLFFLCPCLNFSCSLCSTFFLVSLVMSFSFRVFEVSPGIMAESSHDCHQYIGECVKLTSTQLDSSYQQNLKHSPLRLEEIIFETG